MVQFKHMKPEEQFVQVIVDGEKQKVLLAKLQACGREIVVALPLQVGQYGKMEVKAVKLIDGELSVCGNGYTLPKAVVKDAIAHWGRWVGGALGRKFQSLQIMLRSDIARHFA